MDPPRMPSPPPPSGINIKSSFVSQEAIDEHRARREEAWSKAHANAEKPPPMPEEPYDPRTLYERLKEQRDKKDADFSEATRLGNLIHRLDTDEVHFLAEMDAEKSRKELDIERSEAEELARFRSDIDKARSPSPTFTGVADVPVQRETGKKRSLDERRGMEPTTARKTLAGLIVKRPRKASSTSPNPPVHSSPSPLAPAAPPPTKTPPAKAALGGLVDYGSDSDSDE